MDIKNDYVIEWQETNEGEPIVPTLIAKCNANNEGLNNIIDAFENELDIVPKTKKWESKYNSYVVYDYEPLSVEGFDLIRKYDDTNRARFFQHLIDKRLSNINILETYKEMKGHIDNEHTFWNVIEI